MALSVDVSTFLLFPQSDYIRKTLEVREVMGVDMLILIL
jgi:hypothetical protein